MLTTAILGHQTSVFRNAGQHWICVSECGALFVMMVRLRRQPLNAPWRDCFDKAPQPWKPSYCSRVASDKSSSGLHTYAQTRKTIHELQWSSLINAAVVRSVEMVEQSLTLFLLLLSAFRSCSAMRQREMRVTPDCSPPRTIFHPAASTLVLNRARGMRIGSF